MNLTAWTPKSVLFAAPLARFIPLAVLAAILMVVCYKMGEPRLRLPSMWGRRIFVPM